MRMHPGRQGVRNDGVDEPKESEKWRRMEKRRRKRKRVSGGFGERDADCFRNTSTAEYHLMGLNHQRNEKDDV